MSLQLARIGKGGGGGGRSVGFRAIVMGAYVKFGPLGVWYKMVSARILGRWRTIKQVGQLFRALENNARNTRLPLDRVLYQLAKSKATSKYP